jgi:hypothetical protein
MRHGRARGANLQVCSSARGQTSAASKKGNPPAHREREREVSGSIHLFAGGLTRSRRRGQCGNKNKRAQPALNTMGHSRSRDAPSEKLIRDLQKMQQQQQQLCLHRDGNFNELAFAHAYANEMNAYNTYMRVCSGRVC